MREKLRIVFHWAIIGLVVLAALPHHAAAQDYPIHSVTILVPFAPSGGTDIIARAIAQKLEHRFGKSSLSRTPAYRR